MPPGILFAPANVFRQAQLISICLNVPVDQRDGVRRIHAVECQLATRTVPSPRAADCHSPADTGGKYQRSCPARSLLQQTQWHLVPADINRWLRGCIAHLQVISRRHILAAPPSGGGRMSPAGRLSVS